MFLKHTQFNFNLNVTSRFNYREQKTANMCLYVQFSFKTYMCDVSLPHKLLNLYLQTVKKPTTFMCETLESLLMQTDLQIHFSSKQEIVRGQSDVSIQRAALIFLQLKYLTFQNDIMTPILF